jgi:hypothetical protein
LKANRSNSESQTKKFNRCTLDVREIPLERFRLERDGRKWKQSARSRSDLLSRLATYANPDGTFESEDRKKNFSPSAAKLLRSYVESTLYRLTNDLCQLGLLSWEREKKHYGRRTYRIHFQPEKHLPYSQEQLPHSQKTPFTTLGDNTFHHARCYHLPYSPESKQNTSLADSSSTPLRLLEPLPSLRATSLCAAAAEHFSPNTQLDSKDRRRLKATALSGFKKKHGDRFNLATVELLWNLIEERMLAKATTITSTNYFVTALENEGKKQGLFPASLETTRFVLK